MKPAFCSQWIGKSWEEHCIAGDIGTTYFPAHCSRLVLLKLIGRPRHFLPSRRMWTALRSGATSKKSAESKFSRQEQLPVPEGAMTRRRLGLFGGLSFR